MSAHVHAWTPIPLESACYESACGATGYRKRGAIVEHRQRLRREPEVTALGCGRGDGAISPVIYRDTGARNK